MTGVAQGAAIHSPLSDLVTLIKHIGRISVWEPPGLPRAKRIARARENERRIKLIKELAGNLKRSFQ